MQRRDFITIIGGGAAAWPVVARAQKPPLPVIGYLNVRKETAHENPIIKQINQALAEMGFVEGRNFNSEYRFADNHRERLAEAASDLVRRDVSVIVTASLPEALAAKAATASIPVLFYTGADPVANGLVASMNRPGGNLTGAVNLNTDLIAKRLALFHELVPTVELIAYLANPANNKAFADAEANALRLAASALSLHLLVLNASEPAEIENAFAALARDRVGGLVVGADAYFLTRPNQIADLASRYKIPANYAYRDYTAAGGLVSYGINRLDGYRIVGIYAGRILRGEKPADLPVQAPTKFELVINLKTAKSLDLTIPPGVLAIADEVIE
jgi:putative ABC transport system substrate-binding protein